MTILPVLLLATTMAIFGTLGYLKGSKWAFISLLILLLAFSAIKVVPDQIISSAQWLVHGCHAHPERRTRRHCFG